MQMVEQLHCISTEFMAEFYRSTTSHVIFIRFRQDADISAVGLSRSTLLPPDVASIFVLVFVPKVT